MNASFVRAFRSEWLKQKRSFASALVLGGSLFTPVVVAAVRLTHPRSLPSLYASPTFWPSLWRACWESMAVFFLPLGAILITSLITQIEFRSNAWKQVHALPLSTTSIFVSKLCVILVRMVQFLVLFNLGVYASGMLPHLLVPGVPLPQGAFSSLPFWRESALYFVDCLPIVAAQYFIALRVPNALVPIGIGFVAWVGALASVSSRFAIWWPYSYSIIRYIRASPKGAHLASHTQLHWLAMAFFLVLTVISAVAFITKQEKG